MPEIIVARSLNNHLVAADEQSNELISSLKRNVGLRLKYSRQRNIDFHRKYFALLNIAFDRWEPLVRHIKDFSLPPEKNFDRFRKDIAIAAGFYKQVVSLNGTIETEAKSISFGKMPQDEFEKLYYKTIDVLLDYIFTHESQGQVDNIVTEIINFT